MMEEQMIKPMKAMTEEFQEIKRSLQFLNEKYFTGGSYSRLCLKGQYILKLLKRFKKHPLKDLSSRTKIFFANPEKFIL